MAFPLTHLCVAWRVLEIMPINDAPQFMLGSIAPDAIHNRKGFEGAAMANIEKEKKITHLCPVSQEKWGQVTDNEGWTESVRQFLRETPATPLTQGYAAHILTDIHNNRTIWETYRTNHPQEAAKGYQSEYYADLRNIDTTLYQEFPAIRQIMTLLSQSTPQNIPNLVTAEELNKISQILQHEQYKNTPKTPPTHTYKFTTYTDTLEFINSAANFCALNIQDML
jgi:hypothetical protein